MSSELVVAVEAAAAGASIGAIVGELVRLPARRADRARAEADRREAEAADEADFRRYVLDRLDRHDHRIGHVEDLAAEELVASKLADPSRLRPQGPPGIVDRYRKGIHAR